MRIKKEVSAEKKEELVQRYLAGELTQQQAAQEAGVRKQSFQRWVARYEAEGSLGLMPAEGFRAYSEETKKQAVEAYLSGEGSLLEICKKFKIRSEHPLRNWLMVYNSGRNFKNRSGGSRMSKTRKTTQEERIQIARECLENGKDYGACALKYQVSYQQVYTWVKKYIELGEAGLEDRRGQRTAQQEPRTEEEELKIRIAQLERENYLLKMERDLLKKVEELERRDACLK